MKNIVIIGNGISGTTAARHIRKKSKDPITIISSETKHFFSRTALMYIYMGHMKYEHTKPYEDYFWEKNKLNLLYDRVVKLKTESKTLLLESGNDIAYDSLILATGSTPNKFGWPGQDLNGVQGLYSFQDLQQMEKNTNGVKNAVIIGGGLIGIEMAEMLKSRGIDITFLVREKSFWDIVLPPEESSMINNHIRNHKVDLRLSTELKEIKGDESGKVYSVITGNNEEIKCQFVGLTVGVSPNIEFLKDSDININRGILINRSFETNVKDIYAIGDCAEFREHLPNRKPVEQVWYTGRMHGEIVASNIAGENKEYRPGPWFNSAKFFDIEYQVYGNVSTKKKDNEIHLYWEHLSGKKSIRVIYDKLNHAVLGINLMGIRFKHEVANHWLINKISIREVIKNFNKGFFDPEFFKTYSKEIEHQYNLTLSDDQMLEMDSGKIASQN